MIVRDCRQLTAQHPTDINQMAVTKIRQEDEVSQTMVKKTGFRVLRRKHRRESRLVL